MKKQTFARPSAGFSLLEVLIAVVILATGLLSLAALQGALARNSADAKARSRVVALLSNEMDRLRSIPYDNVATAAAVNADITQCAAPPDAVTQAACDAALGGLTVTRTVTNYSKSGTQFAAGAAASPNDAQFKRVVISASWTDATGQPRSVEMRSVFSSLSLDANSPLVDDSVTGTIPQGPVVRQATPVTAGMIPIALGNGDSTAASNPTPELVGKNNNQTYVGTRFNVLTYTPSGTQAVIQQRIETEVIKCTCQYGEGGSNLPEIYRQAQWPAVWTGQRYELHVPDQATAAPGQQYASGPVAGVVQSALCQECCRDHHDNPGDTVNPKFDPEATGAYQKYDVNPVEGLVPAGNTTNAQYVDACRVIRVDGFWRTAADMYSRQFGLLETESVGGVQAKTGLPTSTATDAYTTYVKDYLKQYDGTTGTAPAGAQSMYDDPTRGLNNPATVVISTPSTTDYRYLHGRGLYVDFLGKKAREKLADALASRRANGQCLVGGTDLADCVLPYLPFTTINLTEIAKWTSSAESVLKVNSGNILALNPTQPSGSRSYGTRLGTANNVAAMRTSNSGVAVSTIIAGAVDPDDRTEVSDTQPFRVGDSAIPTSGDEFFLRISGGGANPYAFYSISGDTGECIKPSTGDRVCSTNTTFPLSGAIGSLRLEHYWAEINQSQTFTVSATQCTVDTRGNRSVSFGGGTFTVLAPAFQNYRVSSAVIGSGTGTITTPMPAGSSSDNTMRETTTLNFSGLTANSRIDVGFTLESTRTDATIQDCTVSYSSKARSWTLTVTAWNKPWQ